MAFTAMAHKVMTYIVMASIGLLLIYTDMAFIAKAYVDMAFLATVCIVWPL